MATIIGNGATFLCLANDPVSGAEELSDGLDTFIKELTGVKMLAINLPPQGASLNEMEIRALSVSEDGKFEWKPIEDVPAVKARNDVVRLLKRARDPEDNV